jgi:hypothetical protein
MGTELAKIALEEINKQTAVYFEDLTTEIDLFDIAVAEYDGVIIQLLFPNPAAGYPKFQLLKTDICQADPTTYFTNRSGESDLTIQEVIELINSYIKGEEEKFKRKHGI